MQNLFSGPYKTFTNNPEVCQKLLDRLEATLNGVLFRFMEVCGTHTTAIFQSGLRSLFPENVIHLSGPGCPVCVTHESEVELFLQLAEIPNLVIATFGDLIRVPGIKGNSLKNAKAAGAEIQIVYSPLEAVSLAQNSPKKEIVFLGAGFETTAPTVACAILKANALGIKNFSVFSFHKLVPPSLKFLLENNNSINAFLLPGHVAAITGLSPFDFIAQKYGLPGCVTGFEPVDILIALCELAEMYISATPQIKNCYPRAVQNQGNTEAQKIMEKVFELAPAQWRGLGSLPKSGLKIRKEYTDFNALAKFQLSLQPVDRLPGCKCGEILQGLLSPEKCPLFGNKCTPASPIGPCMVSTEGSCAAHFKYGV